MSRALRAFVPVCALALLSIGFVTNAESENRPPRTPIREFVVVRTWPHDTHAYTQGLTFADGVLYEGTGRYGASSLRAIDLDTGRILKRVDLPDTYFGEGIAVLGDKIFQLTWRGRKGFVYNRGTFARLGEFTYDTEGWGLTTDGQFLIMSDGTDILRYLDPESFQVRRTLNVHDDGRPLNALNELEYVKGEILANVWQREVIARIDPRSGSVNGWIDLRGLYRADTDDAVLNGIAYDAEHDRLLVTGKLWPKLFQIRLRREPR